MNKFPLSGCYQAVPILGKHSTIDPVKKPSYLIIARIVYFMFYAAWAALLPFLPLFYKSNGLNGAEIGVLTGIMPLVTLLGAPFWGGVADATQKRKAVLVGVMLGVMASVVILMRVNTYVLLGLVVCLYAFFQSPIIPLIDTSVLAMLGERRSDYGKQRVWGALGWGIAAPVAGWLAGHLGASFRFDMYLIIMAVCVAAVALLPVAGSGLSSGYWQGVGRLLNDRRWLVFLIAVFVGGIGASLVNNFLFLYMSELQSDQTMMGLALTMATVSETPALFFSGWLVRKMGGRGMLMMALTAYAIRLFLYSVVSAPWQVLLIQLTHGLTFSAIWTAGVSYAGQMAPRGMEATAQGLFNAVLMGFGGITGAMIGGLLIDRFGGAGMYRIGGFVVLAGLAVFLLASRRTTSQQT